MVSDTNSLTSSGLNLIAQGLTIYDADLRLAVCNAPFQSIFKLPDELVTPGAPFEATIRHLAMRGEYGDIDDIEAFVRERVEVASAFEPHYMERTRANGRTISVEGSPLPQGGWVTVYTDISSARAQELLLRSRATELSDQVLSHSEALAATNRELAATIAALEEAKRQLTASEARMRLTTEMMPAHIAHADSTRHYTYSNRRLTAILPGRPSDIVGLDFESALGHETYQRIRPHLDKAYAGSSSVFEFTDETSARRIRVAFTPDKDGGVYVLSTDVTEEMQARVALQQTSKRELAAQMTSGLAHDFSNLLTIILGLQSRLARLDGMPDKANDLITGIQSAAQRGGVLLDGIANVTARRTLRPAAVSIPSLLADIELLAAPTLPNDVTLATHCTLPDTPFLLDAGQLQDSLLNLILNARDACGTQGQITLSAQGVSNTWIEFSVTDTGPGFSQDALERGLDPFFTTKGAEGSGLGLPMVYDMTKLAGGDLRLSNHKGSALVRLRLPAHKAPANSGGLVLLVEDREDLRTQYRDILLANGHAVIEAVSSDEALALMADLPEINFVLSDLRLEGSGTGVDLAKRVDGQLPMILMTSLPATDLLHQEAARIAPVLQKPFTEFDLLRLMTSENTA
ncbi:MAG: PAS-domain containing protein [Paracoccaceae bacterium]